MLIGEAVLVLLFCVKCYCRSDNPKRWADYDHLSVPMTEEVRLCCLFEKTSRLGLASNASKL